MAETGDTPFDKNKLAIALAYDREKDQAPKVAAKGKGYIAEQIIALAKEHGVEIREDTDLATLLSKLDVDTFIPLEAYAAVAEILSYIYKANHQMKKAHSMSREPEKLFEDISCFIDESHSLLEQGALMELAGMDDQIRMLCEDVMNLSPAQRVQYAERLKKLLSDLQMLGDLMVRMRDDVAKEISTLSDRQKANMAYRVTNHSVKKQEN